VLAGLSEIPAAPGRKQHPGRYLLECLRDRRDDVLRFAYDLRIPPTSNDAECDLRPAKIQQKSPAGYARSRQPGTGTRSAAICPPRPSTASTS
jgi:hypothetical protein